MTGCPLTDAAMFRHQRPAKRLAARLGRRGDHHQVQPCGDHYHVTPDPLKYAREAITAPPWRRR